MTTLIISFIASVFISGIVGILIAATIKDKATARWVSILAGFTIVLLIERTIDLL